MTIKEEKHRVFCLLHGRKFTQEFQCVVENMCASTGLKKFREWLSAREKNFNVSASVLGLQDHQKIHHEHISSLRAWKKSMPNKPPPKRARHLRAVRCAYKKLLLFEEWGTPWECLGAHLWIQQQRRCFVAAHEIYLDDVHHQHVLRSLEAHHSSLSWYPLKMNKQSNLLTILTCHATITDVPQEIDIRVDTQGCVLDDNEWWFLTCSWRIGGLVSLSALAKTRKKLEQKIIVGENGCTTGKLSECRLDCFGNFVKCDAQRGDFMLSSWMCENFACNIGVRLQKFFTHWMYQSVAANRKNDNTAAMPPPQKKRKTNQSEFIVDVRDALHDTIHCKDLLNKYGVLVVCGLDDWKNDLSSKLFDVFTEKHTEQMNVIREKGCTVESLDDLCKVYCEEFGCFRADRFLSVPRPLPNNEIVQVGLSYYKMDINHIHQGVFLESLSKQNHLVDIIFSLVGDIDAPQWFSTTHCQLGVNAKPVQEKREWKITCTKSPQQTPLIIRNDTLGMIVECSDEDAQRLHFVPSSHLDGGTFKTDLHTLMVDDEDISVEEKLCNTDIWSSIMNEMIPAPPNSMIFTKKGLLTRTINVQDHGKLVGKLKRPPPNTRQLRFHTSISSCASIPQDTLERVAKLYEHGICVGKVMRSGHRDEIIFGGMRRDAPFCHTRPKENFDAYLSQMDEGVPLTAATKKFYGLEIYSSSSRTILDKPIQPSH